MKKIFLAFMLCGLHLFSINATAASTVHVYGPGGPAPAVKAAATAYTQQTGVKVLVQAGPTPAWANTAQQNADILYSGSEAMMSDFTKLFADHIVPDTIEPVYLRPATILVRKNNPKNITGFADLAEKKVKVLVTHGAGQVAMWEDIAARTGDIAMVKAFRKQIGMFAPNTGIAKETWLKDSTFDAWLVFNIWGISNPEAGDMVAIEPDYRIYRPMDIALTQLGQKNKDAQGFFSFITSKEGKEIFKRYGWMEKSTD